MIVPGTRTLRTRPFTILAAAAIAATLALTAPAAFAQTSFGGYPASGMGGFYMENFYLPPAPASTPWYPSWHPDGARLAFSMAGSIWMVELASGEAREIVAGDRYYSSPDISPDGRWVVFTADDHGRSIRLEMLDLRSGVRTVLTDDEHLYSDPRFSPDGRTLAYVSTRPAGYFNVYLRPVENGNWAGTEEAVTEDNDFGRDRLYFGRWDIHISPAWLPSGDELLVVSNRDVPLGSGNVYRVPARAGGFADRRVVLQEQTLYRTQPDVSLDGRRFVFSSTRGAADQFNNLYVQPTSPGGEPYKLTFFEHDAFHPRWSPDGEWIAFVDNGGAGGLPRLRLLETYGGELRDVRIIRRTWSQPMGSLQIVSLDDDGRPTPARVHLTGSDGRFYAPDDSYARIGRAGDYLFHHPGESTVMVPAGTTRLTVAKGFEHAPQTLTVDVPADGQAAVAVALGEVADLNADGWFSGSTHVHMNYGGNLRNSLENLMLMSEAEDQDIVLEQVANKDNRILDHQFFVPGGGPHPLSRPDQVLVVGQEYRPPFYGHVFMFGMTDHLISPFTTGYEDTAIESLYPSNTDMFRKARAQGATTGYVHSFFSGDPLETGLGGAKGFLVDAALGTTDAVEWSTAQDGYPPLYAAWGSGLKVAVVGGEDSISDLQQNPLVGSVRTYVKTSDGRLGMDGFLTGLRNGNAFQTTGPLVLATFGGASYGETVTRASGQPVELRARVTSIAPLDVLEVVFNGEVVDRVSFEGDRTTMDLVRSYTPDGSGWYHLRVSGQPEDRFPFDIPWAQALTNPVWVEVDGEPVRVPGAAEYALRWIDRLGEMAEGWTGWRSDAEKAHVYAQFEEARAVYRSRRAERERPR